MIRQTIPAAHHAEHRMSPEREWLVRDGDTPPLAAHIVTSGRGYTHHGIYVGDGKVVHYAGLSRGWSPGPIEEVSLAEFSRGRTVRVRSPIHPRFCRNDVVARARSRLGENRYRLLSNNCEHFCEWCLFGESRSRQVELLRTRPRSALLQFIDAFRRTRTFGAPEDQTADA